MQGGCQGSIADLAYAYVQQNGIATPYSFPYVSWRGDTNGTCPTPAMQVPVMNITGFTKIETNNGTALQQAVATQGPVVVSVAAVPWQDYSEGVFDGACGAGQGDRERVVSGLGGGECATARRVLVRRPDRL